MPSGPTSLRTDRPISIPPLGLAAALFSQEVSVEKADIAAVHWIRVPRSFQLVVTRRSEDGSSVKFTGFREKVGGWLHPPPPLPPLRARSLPGFGYRPMHAPEAQPRPQLHASPPPRPSGGIGCPPSFLFCLAPRAQCLLLAHSFSHFSSLVLLQDLKELQEVSRSKFGQEMQERTVAISGRNWG